MRRFLRAGGFGLVGLALLATPAVVWGFRIRVVTPIPERVALADVIVIGKVASIGKKPVMVKESGLNREVAYSVAVFEIKETLKGTKGAKKIEVGILGAQQPGQPRIPSLQTTTLTQGQDLCLMLKKHESGKFHVLVGGYDYNLNKKSPNYRNSEALTRRCVKLLANPDKSLKSNVRSDRVLTASMLVYQYRDPVGSKEDEIDANQSKLIMRALAEGDWTDVQPVFFRLGPTEKDGWKGPQAVRGRTQPLGLAARQWLNANISKYRIKRFVPDMEESKDTKKEDK
jgi:hypothetical protein